MSLLGASEKEIEISLSLTIVQVKQRIGEVLKFTVVRLLLEDRLLDDDLLVEGSELTASISVRGALDEHNWKKRRVNHNPGSRDRRDFRAQRTEDAFLSLLALEAVANQAAFFEQVALDGEVEKELGSHSEIDGFSFVSLADQEFIQKEAEVTRERREGNSHQGFYDERGRLVNRVVLRNASRNTSLAIEEQEYSE